MREGVAGIQQRRLLVAMTEVCAERGLAEASIARVVSRAGVSRRTFYEVFEDREACFLAALEDAIERVSDRVVTAYGCEGRWWERVRAALVALLGFLAVERARGRLLIVESLGAGRLALERRAEVLSRVALVIDKGREESRGEDHPSGLRAEGVIGGVLSVIHGRLVVGEEHTLPELTNPLMGMIVLPYLGASASRRELERPVPPIAAHERDVSRDPLRGLGIRLTYRTVRVLLAVGGNPGASNRQVGLAAEVEDQGQISKLLTRLMRIGLVANAGGGQSRGRANAWSLTERGQDVHRAIAAPVMGD